MTEKRYGMRLTVMMEQKKEGFKEDEYKEDIHENIEQLICDSFAIFCLSDIPDGNDMTTHTATSGTIDSPQHALSVIMSAMVAFVHKYDNTVNKDLLSIIKNTIEEINVSFDKYTKRKMQSGKEIKFH